MSSSKSIKEIINELKRFEDVVAACNRCGFCTSYCPTYNATGSEAHSPRGRNQAFRALLEGKLTDPRKTTDIIDTCLLCGECTSVCFSEVPTAQLMVQARHLKNKLVGVPAGLRFIFQYILPRPRVYAVVAKLAFIGKKIGLSALLRHLKILNMISPTLANADALVSDVSPKFLMDRTPVVPYLEKSFIKREQDVFLAQRKAAALRKKGKSVPDDLLKKSQTRPPRPRIAYMPVCGSNYLKSSIGESTVRLFKALKVDFMIPQMGCCGLPAASYGVVEDVIKMIEKNISKLEGGRYEAIVTDDSSCTSHVKEYPQYVQKSPALHERALKIKSKIRDISGFLIQWGILSYLQKYKWNGEPVAFHDPCKAQYGQGITEPPREILNAIPGLKLLPISEADQCCGGGGTYSFVHPELSQEILWTKISHVAQSGCKVLVTSSASCLIQLAFGVKKKKLDIEVLHLSEFLARVIK